ncbi:hypothetical protein HO133_000208 [Letharia lupina]|uniref:Uncharacterized protein n=1 Tax=Letharia lupina TaxID=560253 RepID=A0A8H6CHL9_9LECA|nr:uncharacterized protein HO133_000208 [Letharia lupina]KAF6223366.1 hypothetical protein HO133_000208 [Letharia lupina]
MYRGRKRQDESARDTSLDPTHHLVYFPFVPPPYLLLPDGTDSWHSPGPPFTRRLWAGGSMAFVQDIQVDGQPFHCNESIADVQIRGKEGEEKAFVRIERVIFAGLFPGELKGQPNRELRISEQRSIVFMRDNRPESTPVVSQSSSKVLKPTETPDFSHTIVPTRELLFRFSALTFNAHAIHLDKQFCREVEGYRNLLVQGPLTVVLMIEVLRIHLQTLADRGRFSFEKTPGKITHVEYRNLAPLYAEEEMKICVRKREGGIQIGRTATWDVWIEGRDGGYAVKGTVITQSVIGGVKTLSTTSRVRREVYAHGIVSQEEVNLEGESIPEEQVALQKAINTRNETISNEEIGQEEYVARKEKPEKETEGKTGREAEDEAEETEEEDAPYFQR